MANDLEGLFQTLVAASNSAAAALEYQKTFLRSIFWEYRPNPIQPFTVLNVAIPTVNEADTVDIGNGPLQVADTTHRSVPIPFDHHYSTSFIVNGFDQARTPTSLERLYLKPKLEGLARKVNRTISQFFTPANFPNYSIISGAGADTFARADVTLAWQNLASVGCPMEDSPNLFFTTNEIGYGNMLADSNWVQESMVAVGAAESAQQRARLRSAYGASVEFDQQLAPFEDGKVPGVFYHRFAVAGLTAPPPPTGDSSVRETVFFVGDLPVQLQVQYSIRDQGHLVNLHCFWGTAVARPELGSLLQTA